MYGVGQASSGQDGRAGGGEGGGGGGLGGEDATDCAGVGFEAMRLGGFLPVEVALGCKTVASAYFRGRGACTRYDPKIILGFPDPKGDAQMCSLDSRRLSSC